MQELLYWIWLSLAITPGTENFKKLIDCFDSPKTIYDASEGDIISVIGSKSKDVRALTEKDTEEAKRILDFCKSKNVGIVTFNDDEYPEALRRIPSPPVLLYYRGVLPDFNSNCLITMVGTRRLTDYGRKNAFSIGQDLAKSGAIVVSGMAIGIDGVSHAGSLSADGINVAFLGSGIDVCYPKQHIKLARSIVKNGCVMTEYAPGTKPERHNFPQRNRLIAGISSATIVIEGNIKSGSLITARYAKEYGKTVYALPGNVDNKTSEASNLLIKSGAKLITSADDIVQDFEFVFPGKINPFKIAQKINVTMNEMFKKLEISCVCASDGIFSAFAGKKKTKRKERKSALSDEVVTDNSEAYSEKKIFPEDMGFDKQVLRIYKKIPIDGECTVDSLVDNEDNMPSVMKALLKLEMGCAVTMLPGEKVKRNYK